MVAPEECFGLKANIVGNDNDNDLFGGPGRDVIAAKGGNDHVERNADNDVLCGDAGTDNRNYGVVGGYGDDYMTADGGNDILLGQGASMGLQEVLETTALKAATATTPSKETRIWTTLRGTKTGTWSMGTPAMTFCTEETATTCWTAVSAMISASEARVLTSSITASTPKVADDGQRRQHHRA